MPNEDGARTPPPLRCTCEPCKRKAGIPNAVRPRSIHGYTSTPRNGWRPRFTAAELRRTAPQNIHTFGVELETSAPANRYTDLPNRPHYPYLPYGASGAQRAEYQLRLTACRDWDRRNREHRQRQAEQFRQRGDMTAEEAVSVAAPRGLWWAKHDGSVSGPEFASQPGSLAYWRHQAPALERMFTSLVHGGMRSHDGDTCGLHVNIGSNAFGKFGWGSTEEDQRTAGEHLYRLATLLCDGRNARWAKRMSQRTDDSLHWADFGYLGNERNRRNWAIQFGQYGYAGGERYSVLNAGNEGRVEFRLPRGTLRIDRFYSKLEWTAAMVAYTKDPDNATTPVAFMRWVAERPSEYPYLLAYMRERFATGTYAFEEAANASVS